MRVYIASIFAVIVVATTAPAQPPYNGNTLITPVRSTESYLIDINLNRLQTWFGTNGAGHTAYLFPDGSLLRAQGDPSGPIQGGGGSGGHLQRIAADNSIIWDYFFSNSEHQQHHDIEPMPNGNVLVIAWEVVTAAEAAAAGRVAPVTTRLLPTLIAELQPVGNNDANVVWEWRIWDHIIQDNDANKPNFGVIADHPERIDVDLGNTNNSWDHANFIDYHPRLDQIVFSARRMEEVYVIDHSTTTAQAAGHSGGRYGKGGDILYRWGNPQNYGRGTDADRVFWGVHGANWINDGLPGAGGILAFNNGDRPGDLNDYSGVVEIHPPGDGNGNYPLGPGEAYGPATPEWEYSTGGPGFFSMRYGSAFRMPNGNTLVCDGFRGLIFEVTTGSDRVWAYVEPVGAGVFAAQRYPLVTVPILIQDFDAVHDDGAVELTWDIEADEVVSGFRIYRANSRDGIDYPLNVGGLLDPTLRGYSDRTIQPGQFYRYTLAALNGRGDEIRSQSVDVRSMPAALALEQNQPNPFNPVTRIGFSLPQGGHVSLQVFDVQGRLVRTLHDGFALSGMAEVEWDGRDAAGNLVSSGVYFYRLDSESRSLTRKMILMK